MSYRVNINGVVIACDSTAEAVALANHAAKVTQTRTLQAKVRGRGPTVVAREKNAEPKVDKEDRKAKNREQVARFLTTISRANGHTIGGQALLKGVGCENASALGGVLANAHRMLAELKIPFDDAAVRIRQGDTKVWKAGPRLQEAIDKLKELRTED